MLRLFLMNPTKHFDQAVFDRLMSGIQALGHEFDPALRSLHEIQLRQAIVALVAIEGLSEAQGQMMLQQVDAARHAFRQGDEMRLDTPPLNLSFELDPDSDDNEHA
jgi:hypothetical protein